MRKLGQEFSDPLMEKEYSQFIENTTRTIIKMTLFFLVLASISLALQLVLNDETILGAITFCCNIPLLILLFLIQRNKKLYVYPLRLLVVFFWVGGHLIIAHKEDEDSSLRYLLRGWYLSGVQIALLAQFSNTIHQIIVTICSLIGQFLILRFFNKNIFAIDSVAATILLDILLLALFFSFSRSQRNHFQSITKYKQELSGFNGLLESLVSQPIAIINPATMDLFFTNKAWKALFPISQSKKTRFPSPQSLGLLRLEMNKSKDPTELNISPTLPESVLTLQDYIRENIRVHSFGHSPILINVSAQINQEKKAFEAKLTYMTWDLQPAIGLVLNDLTPVHTINRLKEVSESKDLLIATVAHEFRTPLNGILGLLDIMRIKLTDEDDLQHLSYCKDLADFLLNLVNSFLDLQQINVGKLRFLPSFVSLQKLVGDATKLFSFSASNKRVYINMEFDKNIPDTIMTDGNRLKQILINLIGNAMKFTFQGGITVNVYTSPEDPKLIRFEVSDTGVGIKEDQKRKLFRQYSKVEDPDGINKGSVGLGLTIANTLAKLLQNEGEKKGIEMESIYGVGSKFWFDIREYTEDEAESGKEKKERSSFEEENNENENDHKEISLDAWPSIIDIDIGEPDEPIRPINLEARIAKYNEQRRSNISAVELSLKMSRNTSQEILFMDDSFKPNDESPFSRSKLTLPSQFSQFSSIKRPGNDEFGVMKYRVLVVDDNAFNLFVARNKIEGLGCTVETVESGKQAIEEVQRRIESEDQFQLIFMDLQMPIMNGFEAARKLNEIFEENSVGKIPIVALTAGNYRVDSKAFLESGIKDFLPKPFLREDIYKIVTKYCV